MRHLGYVNGICDDMNKAAKCWGFMGASSIICRHSDSIPGGSLYMYSTSMSCGFLNFLHGFFCPATRFTTIAFESCIHSIRSEFIFLLIHTKVHFPCKNTMDNHPNYYLKIFWHTAQVQYITFSFLQYMYTLYLFIFLNILPWTN